MKTKVTYTFHNYFSPEYNSTHVEVYKSLWRAKLAAWWNCGGNILGFWSAWIEPA